MNKLRNITARSLSISLFLVLLIAGLTVLNYMMVPQGDAVGDWLAYKRLPKDSVDVLFVGNSHSYCTFSPLDIWSQTGITSWNISESSINQRHKLTFLQEALKTQSPSLVVVEVWLMDSPIRDDEPGNRSAYRSLPFTPQKIQSVVDTAEPKRYLEYLVPLADRHFAWQEFSRATVGDAFSSLMNARITAGARPLVEPPDNPVDLNETRAVKLNEDEYRHNINILREISALCSSRGANLLLCLAPMSGIDADEAFVRFQNDVSGWPQKVDTLNMNVHQSEIGLVELDFYDQAHLYLWGMKKTSKWFGEKVLSRYDLRDHRSEAYSGQWNEWYRRWESNER